MGAARVPRSSFKTAYTSKKTKIMSATLRGSIIRFKYSVYGSRSNISTVRAVASRGLEKYHLHLRLSAFNPLFDLFDRVQNIAGNQIVFKLHVRVNQNLFWRQMHRQQLNHVFDVMMTLNCLPDCRNFLRISGFTQQQPTRCARQHKGNDRQHHPDHDRSETIPVSSRLASDLMVSEPEPGEGNHDSYQRGRIFKEHCLGRRILRLAKVLRKSQAFMVRFINFLVDRQSDGTGL